MKSKDESMASSSLIQLRDRARTEVSRLRQRRWKQRQMLKAEMNGANASSADLSYAQRASLKRLVVQSSNSDSKGVYDEVNSDEEFYLGRTYKYSTTPTRPKSKGRSQMPYCDCCKAYTKTGVVYECGSGTCSELAGSRSGTAGLIWRRHWAQVGSSSPMAHSRKSF